MLGYEHHLGVILSADPFYEIEPWLNKFKPAFGMECASLFVQYSNKGLRSGALLATDGKTVPLKPSYSILGAIRLLSALLEKKFK